MELLEIRGIKEMPAKVAGGTPWKQVTFSTADEVVNGKVKLNNKIPRSRNFFPTDGVYDRLQVGAVMDGSAMSFDTNVPYTGTDASGREFTTSRYSCIVLDGENPVTIAARNVRDFKGEGGVKVGVIDEMSGEVIYSVKREVVKEVNAKPAPAKA